MRDHTEREREAYPMRTLTDAQLTALIRAARVANPPHPAPEVEDAPRDAQPARFEHPDP